MLCPACENESENIQHCSNCGWQFVYFTQEPTVKEQEEYTLRLQNYRTELYFTLAVQYYDKKQYKEVIECCKISCENNLFENPLGLMASAYFELRNKEEAINFANMALKINPKNEFALFVLANITNKQVDMSESQNLSPNSFEKSFNIDNIQQLTTKILKKDMFETTEEYKERIENLGYIRIGTVIFENYNADTHELTFTPYYDYDDNGIKDYYGFPQYHYGPMNQDDYNINFNLNISGVMQQIQIPPNKAKNVYKNAKLIARISIVENTIHIVDIMLNNYSFLSSIKESPEKIINFEDAIKIWTDKETNLTWEVKTIANIDMKYSYALVNEYIKDLNTENFGGYSDWRLPAVEELESIISMSAVNNKFIKRALSHNCSHYRHWSSEEAYYESQMVTVVSYHNGTDTKDTVKNNACNIRAVRG